MNCLNPKAAVLYTLLLLFTLPTQAQESTTPHIGYVYPAGGRQGTTFVIKVGGQWLDEATNAFLSGSGIKTTVLDYTKPLTPQQVNALREKLKELQDKRQAVARAVHQDTGQGDTNLTWTSADEKAFIEARQKLMNSARRPLNPAIAEIVTLRVTVASNAPSGYREIRLRASRGLSNPMRFCIDELPEFNRPAPGETDEPAQRRQFRNNEPRATPPTDTRIVIPSIINGQILPGGIDRFHFQGRKGQHLVIAAKARELIPYLPDAVPGWFQAALTLYDSKGNEIAYADHYRFHPDPVLLTELPANGEYVLEIRDSIYRGREDFVYRITVGELPFLTGIFPLGGLRGKPMAVELAGWNLPVTNLTIEHEDAGEFVLRDINERSILNPLPVLVDSLPECMDQKPNDSLTNAQLVTLPTIINGRITRPGEGNVFRFQGCKGEQIVAETYARRLGSTLDSMVELTDAAGHQLAFNDDWEDKARGLETHHADSYLRTTLPADGTYFVHLTDAQRQGGLSYAYRLRLGAPRPDFELRVVPSSITARPGATVPVTIYAIRKDGFSGEIGLRLKDAPAGFVLGGARVPENTDQVRVTLTAPSDVSSEPRVLSLEGTTIVNGQEISRPVIPADDVMQAFAYHHLVPAQELKIIVIGLGRFGGHNWVRILDKAPVKIPMGGVGRVRLGTPSSAFAERFQLELNDPPKGVALRRITPTSEGAELVFECDKTKGPKNIKGNLIVNVLPKALASAQNPKGPANGRRAALTTLPAIPFEITDAQP